MIFIELFCVQFGEKRGLYLSFFYHFLINIIFNIKIYLSIGFEHVLLIVKNFLFGANYSSVKAFVCVYLFHRLDENFC